MVEETPDIEEKSVIEPEADVHIIKLAQDRTDMLTYYSLGQLPSMNLTRQKMRPKR